jgi:hypothetical protein
MSEHDQVVRAPGEGSHGIHPQGDRPQLVHASDEHAAGALPSAVGVGRRRLHRREASPHAHKFRAVTAALVGLAIGAIVIAVTVASGPSKKTAPTQAWSDWRPTDNGLLGAREIADHVAPYYRISAVDQLAVITVVNLANSTAAAAASASGTSVSGLQVAVQVDPTSSAVSLLGGNTIAYNLCGIGGSNCAIGVGQPSANRLLLLRREALELALYTFKYISGTDNVVALLPPGYEQTTSTLSAKPPSSHTKSTGQTPVNLALLFVHQELTPWLGQPLSSTLPEQFPPTVPAMGSAPEAGLVDQITARGLFSEKLVQAQDGSDLIVLDPLPPQ